MVKETECGVESESYLLLNESCPQKVTMKHVRAWRNCIMYRRWSNRCSPLGVPKLKKIIAKLCLLVNVEEFMLWFILFSNDCHVCRENEKRSSVLAKTSRNNICKGLCSQSHFVRDKTRRDCRTLPKLRRQWQDYLCLVLLLGKFQKKFRITLCHLLSCLGPL